MKDLSLFGLATKALRGVDASSVVDSLKGAAGWLEAATTSAHGKGVCHRGAIYHHDGEIQWVYPRSNTAEVISAWLDLAELLDRPDYLNHAEAYGAWLVNEPFYGIYRGPEKEAHGLAWYWADVGAYTGGYSMRMPFHLERLYQITKNPKLLEACDVIGKVLLRRQTECGLSDVAWSPERGWAEGGERMGSRYFSTVASYATLYRITGHSAYRQAYERVADGLLQAQKPNGSFVQYYHTQTGVAMDTSVKLHFFSYLFNGIAEAQAVFEDTRLLECAVRMAGFLSDTYRYRQALPYCLGKEMQDSDRTEADAAVHDSANGLLWLYEQTGQESHRDLGIKLWMDAWLNQIDAPGHEGTHGALFRGINPDLAATLPGIPETRVHLQHDTRRVGRCDLWFLLNHIFASKRLLKSFKNPELSEDHQTNALIATRKESLDDRAGFGGVTW